MMKWVNARGAIREAHNALVRRLTAEGGEALVNTPAAAAAAERVALGVWLASCGFDELPGGEAADSPAAAKAALDAYGDVYSAIHRHVSDILPAVIVKAFHPPTGAYPTDAEAGLLWFYAGGGEDKDQEDEDLPAGVNRGVKPAVVCWFGDGGGVAVDPAAGWKDMAGDCITHSFAFAVPSAPALDAIANLGKGLQTPRVALETSSVPYRPAPVSCLSVVLCVSLRDAGGAMARDDFRCLRRYVSVFRWWRWVPERGTGPRCCSNGGLTSSPSIATLPSQSRQRRGCLLSLTTRSFIVCATPKA